MLVIRFSWLQSAGADSLRGYEEWVRLPYRRFHECVGGRDGYGRMELEPALRAGEGDPPL